MKTEHLRLPTTALFCFALTAEFVAAEDDMVLTRIIWQEHRQREFRQMQALDA